MSLQIYDERAPLIGDHVFLIADGTVPKTIATVGAYGGRIDNALTVNNTAAVLAVAIYVLDGANDYPLATVNVPASAGTAGVAPADLLTLLGTLAAGGLVLPANAALQAAPITAVAADGDLVVTALGGSF